MTKCPESDRAYGGKLPAIDAAYAEPDATVDPEILARIDAARRTVLDMAERIRALRRQHETAARSTFVPYECTCYLCGGQWDIRRFGLLGHRCQA